MPVVVVMFIVLLGLLAVLRVFLREGYEWARLSLAAVALLIGLAAGLIAFRESPPLVFVVICVVALVVDLAFLVFLAHPDTTEFIRGSWLAHHDAPDVDEHGLSDPLRLAWSRPARRSLLTGCRRLAVYCSRSSNTCSIRSGGGRPRPRSPPGRSGVDRAGER